MRWKVWKARDNEICIEVDCSNRFYFVCAKWRGMTVGRLYAEVQDVHSARLNDLLVSKDVLTHDFQLRWVLARWWPRVGLESFRGRGIGTKMLNLFLKWCAENGISEVSGAVVQTDLNETPGLLAWYRRHGFETCPTAGCPRGAVFMVVWRDRGGGKVQAGHGVRIKQGRGERQTGEGVSVKRPGAWIKRGMGDSGSIPPCPRSKVDRD